MKSWWLHIAKATSENDSRYALTSVRVRTGKAGHIELAATDGKMLFEAKSHAVGEADGPSSETNEEFLVSADTFHCVRGMLDAWPEDKKPPPEVSIKKDPHGETAIILSVPAGRQSVHLFTPPMDGTFPRVEEVWPKGDPVLTVRIDVQRFVSALTILRDIMGGEAHGEATMTFYADNKPVRFDVVGLAVGEEVRALVMPNPKA